MQRFVLLEKRTRRAPLGLRFLDLSRAIAVTDGLTVTAWHTGTSGPQQMAIRSPLTGIYGFRSLPGLRAFEMAERPASDWCGSPPALSPPELLPQQLTDLNTLEGLLSSEENGATANYIIYVEDQMERFLPQVLSMCLPKEQLVEVPLFSAPARQPIVGFGVVRGELVERGTVPAKPASWAMVTISPDDNVTTYVAVADARGMFTTFLPHASVLPPLQGSPPQGSGTINQISWQLTIQVFYQPSQQAFVPGIVPPDTLSILEQERANVYDQDGIRASSLVRALSLGDDVVVATNGYSQLLVDPAPQQSPP